MDFQLLLTFLLGTISLVKNRHEAHGYEFKVSVLVLVLAGVPLLLHVVEMFRGQMRRKRLLDDLSTFILSPSIKREIFSWLYKREWGLYRHQPSRGVGTLAVEETCLCFTTDKSLIDIEYPNGDDSFYVITERAGQRLINNGVSVVERGPKWREGSSTMRVGDMLVEIVYNFLDEALTTKTMYFDSTTAFIRTHPNYRLQSLSKLLSVMKWWGENPTSGICPYDLPKIVEGIAYKHCYKVSEIVRECADEGKILVRQNNGTYATKFG